MKFRKMKVTGIGNEDELNYLIIEKKEGFFEWLSRFLWKGFGGSLSDVVYYDDIRKDEKIVSVKRKVSKEVDKHESFDTNDKVRVDLFYGKERVFLTFHCSLKKREKVMSVLEEISEFKEK